MDRPRKFVLCVLLICWLPRMQAQDMSAGFLDSTQQQMTVGGLASMILDKDEIEIQFNNTLSSFWFRTFEYNAENFRRISNQRRITQFNQSLRVQYGFNDTGRWDLGLEIKYNRYRDDDFARSSPFKVFGKSKETQATNYAGLSSLGLRFRYKPILDKPNLILQASYSFPVGNHESLEKRLLNADLNQFDLIGTYYEALNRTTYYFVQANSSLQFSPARTNGLVGASAFLVKSLWNDLIYLYPGISYTLAAQNHRSGSSNFTTRSHFLFGGLGGQYAFRRNLIFYTFWNIPFILDNGSVYSDIVRGSFTNVSLGFRLIIG